MSTSGLTITAVAARTGLTVPTLRAWEQRYGFPRPERLEGGHRRYSDEEVARIAAVVDERAAGRSIEAAIAAVLAASSPDATDATVFAALRRRRPDVPVHVLSRRAMLAVSRAIEDEVAARADRPTLWVAFQAAERYRAARAHRWRDLARHATSTTVFADFARSRMAADDVREVAIARGAPQEREWALVSEGPISAAALAGWERPDGDFEAVWSVQPSVVRTAADAARALAARYAPSLSQPPAVALTPSDDSLGRGMAIAARAIAALDR